MVATKSEASSSASSLSSTLSTSLNPKDPIGSESTEISTGNSSRRNSGGNSKVRVGVRVRPLTCQEVGQDGKSVVVVNPPEIRLGERRFNYDKVFGENVGQEELYGSISSPLLQSFLDGYNATVRNLQSELLRCFSQLSILSFLLLVLLLFTMVIQTDHGIRADRLGENLHHGKRGAYRARC